MLAEYVAVKKANYDLPARFTPNKMEKLVFSTSVNAHWLKHSERFWYIYETSEGKTFWIVDPGRKLKKPIFDNIWMASQLTRLTKDPYDAQHIPIDTIKFTNNDKTIYFKVKKNPDVLEAEKRKEPPKKKEQDRKRKRGRKPAGGGR